MAERRDPRHPRPVSEEDFEQYLLAQVQAKEIHFPRAVLLPAEERRGFLGSLWARWAPSTGRLRRVRLAPALAYAVILALLVPAYLGVSGLRSPRAGADPGAVAAVTSPPSVAPAPPAALGNPKSLHLGGGQVRGGGPVSVVTIGDADDFVLLSFLAPIRSDPSVVYQAVLTDARGRIVAAKKPLRSTDGRGSFTLVCEGGLLAQGDYVLSVSEATSATVAEAPYQFRFRVARSAP
jgi:hypothetical protein